MKYKIMLACMGGFSTGMLVKKMRAAAQEKNMDVDIEAVAETELMKLEFPDILLLGPQVSHMLADLQTQFPFPVRVIEPVDYGMMNGEKVLDTALRELQRHR
ncbi:PTS sugar transporter subunit IIB [Kalamiella sp. sgz302252]|uniref:PTS sugar transporter subunit IIB n=1 Tax=Pantoea sp. sgz302252 TaxID=3341827 RepID=UPI0036D2D53D